MGRALFALVSDLHVNSALGVCNPACVLDQGQPVPLSKAQLWLWQCFEDLTQRLKEKWRPGDQVFGAVVGDGPDNFRGSTQLITGNAAIVIRMFCETVKPLREICSDGFWVVRGTEAHSGDAGNLEEVAAQILEATRYPSDSTWFSCWLLRVLIGGVSFDLTHHGPMGRLPWTTVNGLGRVVYEIIDEYVRAGETLPMVAVQAHNHRFGDTGNNFPIRVIALPSWQLQNAYGFRVGPRRRADIGGVIVTCESGRIVDVDPVLCRPVMEARWAGNGSS
jgi:hypothetical protein